MAFVACPCFSPGRISLRKRPRSALPIAHVSMNLDAQPASKPLFDALEKPVRVALTREEEKNAALHKNLRLVYPTIEIVHTPCIETTSAEHTDELPERLKSTKFEWIVITSPEGASVFVKAWKKANFPNVGNIAVVGKATGDILKAVGFKISFLPSKATGKTLVKEFPSSLQGETVLYPASAKASDVIVEGLSAKGYSVLRLNTYSTETACFDDKLIWLAKGVHIVTFASPSAVKGWVQNVNVEEEIAVACIGVTSADAAKAAGFRRVHYPEKPGMEGWISAVSDAMKLYEGISTHYQYDRGWVEMDTSEQKRNTIQEKRPNPQHKGLTADKRKPRRSRPELGALSSLVSFDGPEAEDSKRDPNDLRNGFPVAVSKAPKSGQEHGHDFARISSAPCPPSTLVSRGVPSLRKTLSQDWLKTGFSPRPGKEPKRELLWGSDCMRSPQRLLSNIPSLRSIPEDNELDGDEGSELSDDNVPPEGVTRAASSSYKSVDKKRADDGEGGSGSDNISKA